MSSKKEGGLQGFLSRAYRSARLGASTVGGYAWFGATLLGKTGFALSTVALVTFMPLIMEIGREGVAVELEKLQVKDFRAQGYNDSQLQQMGFSGEVLFAPAALAVTKPN